jgi:hypothetical protein
LALISRPSIAAHYYQVLPSRLTREQVPAFDQLLPAQKRLADILPNIVQSLLRLYWVSSRFFSFLLAHSEPKHPDFKARHCSARSTFDFQTRSIRNHVNGCPASLDARLQGMSIMALICFIFGTL